MGRTARPGGGQRPSGRDRRRYGDSEKGRQRVRRGGGGLGRAQYLGDPDFIDMPVAQLIDKNYAAGLRSGIRMDRATRSDERAPVTADYVNGHHTTHLSIIDGQGNRVAATLSVNFPFGSGLMASGTGVFLNDEMDDFAAKPLTPNGYGLVGTEANAIAPGKRPLSSMSPSVSSVFRAGRTLQ